MSMMKNSEGYSDPTAGQAIKNILREEKKKFMKSKKRRSRKRKNRRRHRNEHK